MSKHDSPAGRCSPNGSIDFTLAWCRRSLLLATSLGIGCLLLARDDLAKHDHAVAIHEGNTREALAVLEGVAHQRLLRCKGALCHLVGLQGVRIFHLLAASFLAHLPLELGNPAGSAAAAHEA